jgi:ribosomal-protein-alanine N-acetyltransferase
MLKIESERLFLSLPVIDSEAQIVRFYQDNEEHLSPWDPKKPEGFFTESYWKLKVEQAHQEFEDQESLRLNIYHSDSKELIGMCNFTSFERGPFQCCRLGYKISKSYEGKGYMFEALEVAIKYIFDDLNFHRIEANYIPENIRSGNLLKRLGFEENGLAKNYLLIDGKWQDHILTSKTNDSWKL